MAVGHYSNPDGIPDEAKKKGECRSINMRFASEQDMIDFVAKTGIKINEKTNTYKFTKTNLDEFFQ